MAAEIARDEGPFVAPQSLYRYNVFAKVSYDITPSTLVGLFFQAYGSRTRATAEPSRSRRGST